MVSDSSVECAVKEFYPSDFFALICQCKLYLYMRVLILKKQQVLLILKCQTRHAVVVFLVCVFLYMAVKVTNKSRSSVCEADAPFLLGFTSHGALGLTRFTLRQVNLKPPPGKFFSAKAPMHEQELH